MVRKLVVFAMLALCLMSSLGVAQAPALRFPLQEGETWILTRAYNAPPTHASTTNDRYALDFVYQPCDQAWGKPIYAAAPGVVEYGRNFTSTTGYGYNIFIDHGNGYKTHYAHLSEILVPNGMYVAYTTQIGKCGNTGNVTGSCSDHPGTHLHFKMLHNGMPVKPEPLSGYGDFPDGEPGTSYVIPPMIGMYSVGWLTPSRSDVVLAAYQASTTPLGHPFDNNGGGMYLHYWSDPGPGFPNPGVWIQDLYNPSTQKYSAIILNPNGNAYVMKEGFRDWYTDPAHFGYKELGAPKGNQYVDGSNYVQRFEDGILMRPVAGGAVWREYLVHTAMNNMYAPYLLSASNFTQTSITLAWKDGINPSGTTYKIYRNNAYVASAGTNLYFTDSGLSPNTMYQYKVSALYNNEESIFSNTVIVGTLHSEPSGQTGYLTLVSDPSGANIWRDGAFWKTTPLTNEVMDAGNYSMVAKKTGYGDTEFTNFPSGPMDTKKEKTI